MLVPSTAGEKHAGNFGSTYKFRDRSRSSAVVLGNDTTQSEIAVNSHASRLLPNSMELLLLKSA